MVDIEDKKETIHIIDVLTQAKKALLAEDSFALQELSNQTIHSASIYQHTDFVLIAVLVYSLDKIMAKKEKIKSWSTFVKKFNGELDSAAKELKNSDTSEFVRHLEHAKELLVELTPAIHINVEEILRKASVNKASKIYEHGISLSRTADLLGITQWDMAEYVGGRNLFDNPYNETISVKKRAQNALQFFS